MRKFVFGGAPPSSLFQSERKTPWVVGRRLVSMELVKEGRPCPSAKWISYKLGILQATSQQRAQWNTRQISARRIESHGWSRDRCSEYLPSHTRTLAHSTLPSIPTNPCPPPPEALTLIAPIPVQICRHEQNKSRRHYFARAAFRQGI